MNTKCEKILEDYRKADFTNRLYIFLEFRELRKTFYKIEQKETKMDFFKITLPENLERK